MIIRGQNGTTIVTMEKGLEIRKSFLGDMSYGIWQGDLCLGVYNEYIQAVNVLNEIEEQYVRYLTDTNNTEHAVYRLPKEKGVKSVLDEAYIEVRKVLDAWNEG